MDPIRRHLTRRSMLARLAERTSMIAIAVGAWPMAATALTRVRTPAQTEGPFYPPQHRADAGNDLIHVGGARAEGEPLALSGTVTDVDGKPVEGAAVEIWQCDNRGIYRHPRAPGQGREDPAFAGFGRSVTDASGRYRFLTIVPVPYPGRPPHIHVKIRIRGGEVLTTQLYLKGHPENDRGGLLSWLLPATSALSIEPRAAMMEDGIRGREASYEFVI